MNNQEAIALGVERFCERNQDLVSKSIERGINRAIPEISIQIGMMLSARLGKFLDENQSEFIAVGKEMMQRESLVKLQQQIKMNKPDEPAFDIPERKADHE